MAAIRSKNTKPELEIRRGLHALGFRYRLHAKHLSGKPDIVFPKYNAVLFINGCFWHGHNCRLFQWPKNRSAFWREKISRNVARDLQNENILQHSGWRVGVVWECALRKPTERRAETLLTEISMFLRGTESYRWFEGAHTPRDIADAALRTMPADLAGDHTSLQATKSATDLSS